MENKHSTKVVRLLRREPVATRITLPKKTNKVLEFSVDIGQVKYSESKNVTRVMLTSRANEKTAYKNDLDKAFYKKEQRFEYGFAFASGIMPKLASVFLIPMILIYPLYPAYAAEESITQNASSTEATTPPSSSNALQSGKNDSNDKPQTTADNSAATSSLIAPDASSTSAIPSTSEGAVLGSVATSTTESATDTPSTPPVSEVGSGTRNDTSTSTPTPISKSQGTASDTPPVILAPQGGSSGSNNTASSTATTTLPNDASSTEIRSVGSVSVGTDVINVSANSTTSVEAVVEKVHTQSAEELAQEIIKQKEDSMRASIRKEVEGEYSKGCLTIDNLGYYCLKDPKGQSGSLTPSGVVTGVNSQLVGGSAYKQIFMTKGGASTQITHDEWDDTFPSIDVSGKSIVWQGNVNGRWQIFFASAATATTPAIIALTHSNESNFNPRVDGDDVVWQGWVDGNWEIFLAEHLSPENYLPANNFSVENTRLGIDHAWKVTRITSNSVHDMFPSVSGGLVTWQSFQDNAWAVYAYSIKTGATTKLSTAGAKSENPRFAITWDERTPEGAAHMVGYDIASGKTIDLTSEARQVSDDSKPYQPQAPISQDNQAALPPPATTTATTSVMKGDGDDGSTANGLGV